MNFIIIANAWSAGKDNPTSKHRIALELVRQGHRVLWIEGSGMRTPSVGSSSDRLRMIRKVMAALRGVRREEQTQDLRPKTIDPSKASPACKSKVYGLGSMVSLPPPPSLWVLSPLFIPLPRYELIRRLNGLICRCAMRFWGWRLGFRDPVLINYVPVLAEAMRGARSTAWTLDPRPKTLDPGEAPPELGSKVYGLKSMVPRCAARIVYHCVDRWDAFAMYDSAMMTEMDRRCCEYADLVIASSVDLVERCRRHSRNVHLVSHGVDWEHFHHAVAVVQPLSTENTPHLNPLPQGERKEGNQDVMPGRNSSPSPLRGEGGGEGVGIGVRMDGRDASAELKSKVHGLLSKVSSSPVIGFFGLLSEWVDQALLLQVAAAVPDATLVLIGKADVDVSRLKGVPNIRLLGPIPFSELPGHIAGFTVGLIPFVVNELTKAVNPIKLREMLSAGCPVVSTALPEVDRCCGRQSTDHPPPVQVAHTHDEFVAMVKRVVDQPLSREERRALSDSMASETWSAKVGEILELVGVPGEAQETPHPDPLPQGERE